MHLVDNINLILALRWRIRHFFPNLTDIVNTVVGCRINLDHIHGSLLIDRTAHSTFIAGTAIDRMFAIHCLGKNLGNGSLTGSSCTAKQIGMPDTIHLYLIF